MSTSTSSTVQVTNGGRTKTTTTIYSKKVGDEWVEEAKTTVIEETTEPLLNQPWAKPYPYGARWVDEPYFGDPNVKPVMAPPPGTPWGSPAIWA